MPLNLLIGGAAGQGIDTAAAILERALKKAGFYVYANRDFMSRVRGGHNFIQIRFGSETITSHSPHLDGLIAFNEETVRLHLDRLSSQGFVLCDSTLAIDDPRAAKVDMQQIAKSLGNPRVFGSVAVGAVLGLLGLDPAAAGSILEKTFGKAEIGRASCRVSV